MGHTQKSGPAWQARSKYSSLEVVLFLHLQRSESGYRVSFRIGPGSCRQLTFVDIKPPEARELKANVPQEFRIVGQIASPEPAWHFDQTIQPLQATALHPAGSVGEQACVDVECSPDSGWQGSVETIGIPGHE